MAERKRLPRPVVERFAVALGLPKDATLEECELRAKALVLMGHVFAEKLAEFKRATDVGLRLLAEIDMSTRGFGVLSIAAKGIADEFRASLASIVAKETDHG